MDNFEKVDGDCRRERRYLSACQAVDRKIRISSVAGEAALKDTSVKLSPAKVATILGVTENVARSKIENTVFMNL